MTEPSKIQSIDLLKGVDLFSALPDSHLEAIARKVFLHKYKKGETILHEEDTEGHSLFIIAKGHVKVFLTGVDGREAILALLHEGEFFGEMSLLDGEPRSASVRALAATEMLVLKREDFFQVIMSQPEVLRTLLVEMSKRLRKANRQASNLALMSVYGRVAATVKRLIEEQGVRIRTERGEQAVIIRDRPSHQELADMSGTTRETVSRVLAQFQKKQILSLSGKDLVVLEETALD